MSFLEKFKNRSRPRKHWVAIISIAAFIFIFLITFMIHKVRQTAEIGGTANTAAMRSDVQTTAGGEATPNYNEKLREYNKKEAEKAKQKHESHISTVIVENEDETEEIKKEPEPDPREQAKETRKEEELRKRFKAREQAYKEKMSNLEQRYQRLASRLNQQRQSGYSRPNEDSEKLERLSTRYSKQISQVLGEMNNMYAEQQVQVFDAEQQAPEQGSTESGGPPSEQEEDSGLGIAPGDILYARNEMRLNSDAPGPAQATILSGEYKGAKLLGGFERTEDYLGVSFNRLILPDGSQHSIEAVAIDPNVPSTAVRSDVDRHLIQRWGSLMAASFLSGLGNAISSSGSSMTVANGEVISSQPKLDTQKELWAAGGKVGSKLEEKFDSQFDRPMTVTLEPGTHIGILFLETE